MSRIYYIFLFNLNNYIFYYILRVFIYNLLKTTHNFFTFLDKNPK